MDVSPSGNYSQALEDLQECLRLQQKHLDPDSRLLAETHYQLGLTHTLHCQYGLAIQQLQNAAAVITSRLGMYGTDQSAVTPVDWIVPQLGLPVSAGPLASFERMAHG